MKKLVIKIIIEQEEILEEYETASDSKIKDDIILNPTTLTYWGRIEIERR